jgi:hypothetical protein
MITSQMEGAMDTSEVEITTIEATMAQIITVSEGTKKKMIISSTGVIVTVVVRVSLEVISQLSKPCRKTKTLSTNLCKIKLSKNPSSSKRKNSSKRSPPSKLNLLGCKCP